MRTMLIALPLAAAGTVMAAAATLPGQSASQTRAEREAARVPAATPAGKPESCVLTSRIRQTHVRNDSVIDFEMLGGKVYRNTLPVACPRLGFEESFAYKTSVGQLCSVDTITVLDTASRIPGPTCGLGRFQPVTLARK